MDTGPSEVISINIGLISLGPVLRYGTKMFFSENKSYSVVQKKAFFDGKPKMTKKIGFENVEIPKMGGG